MFGYILPEKGELKVKEYELYNAYYCGLCKNIARRYGQIPRLILNYDFVFLAIILTALENKKTKIDMEHCVLHHIKKKPVAKEEKGIDYAADITLVMAYYKLLDDFNDDGSRKAKMLARAIEGSIKSIKRQYGGLCELIKDKLEELSVLEKNKVGELDRVMEPFAEIMKQVFKKGIYAIYDDEYSELETGRKSELDIKKAAEKQNDGRLLEHIGYHLGKWVYLADAYDDIEENIEKNTYNPLLYRFDYESENETPKEFRERIREVVSFNLIHYLAEISNAVDLLDIKKNAGIIENIAYLGLRRKTEDILYKNDKEEEKSDE